jgi:CRISPR-associated protein Cas2
MTGTIARGENAVQPSPPDLVPARMLNEFVYCPRLGYLMWTDAKRLRKVFKVLNGYGDHLQYSVFRCDLSKKERILLLTDLSEVIHHKDDQVLFVDLGPAEGVNTEARISALGQAYEPKVRRVVVV